MRCVHCAAPLELFASALRCTACSREFTVEDGVPMLLDERARSEQTAAGHMEALFRFPAFYRVKHEILLHLNKTDPIDLTHHLTDKHVIDVGCGPFPYGFDSSLPASIVGLDFSPQFVHAMARRCPQNLYVAASATKIPFADKTFDTALLRFVIHHIPGNTAELLREVARVARHRLIIFDHVRSDVPWQAAVQTTYWRTFDSGHYYNTTADWEELLRPYHVLESRRSGLMFGNVCHIAIDLSEADPPRERREPLFRANT